MRLDAEPVAEIPLRDPRLIRSLEFGMIAVNRTSITGPSVPFGGMKRSGLGREGSRLGRDAFTKTKYICEKT